MRHDIFPERNLEPPDYPEAPELWPCPRCGHDAPLWDYDGDEALYRCEDCGMFAVPYDDWADSDPDSTGCAHEPYDAWVERQWR